MPRKQVNDLQAPERLQTLARSNVATEIVSQPNTAGSRLSSLAEGLGLASSFVGKQKEAAALEAKANAEDFFNSHTPEEIGRMTRDGKLPADKNPIWVAHVQHLQGNNELSRITRETANGIETGDLQFGSDEELEAHLINQRNEVLQSYAGNKYVTGGFDKNFIDIKNRLLGVHSKTRTEDTLIVGEQVTTEALKNLTTVQYESTEDFVATVRSKWDELKSRDRLINSKNGADIFSQSFAIPLLEKGDVDNLDALLASKDPSGISFETVIGSARAKQFRRMALTEKLSRDSQQSISNNQLAVFEAAKQGKLLEVPDELPYLKKDGSTGVMKKAELLSDDSVDTLLAQYSNPNQQVAFAADNGITVPAWKQTLESARTNLFQVGIPDAQGKPTKLNDQAMQAIDLYSRLKDINPGLIPSHIKDEKTRNQLDDITDLMDLGVSPDEAAKITTQASTSKITLSDAGNNKADLEEAVESALSSTTNTGLLEGAYNYFFEDDASNSPEVTAKIRRFSDLLIRSGKADSYQAAAEMAVGKIRNGSTATLFHGRLYYNSELPKVDVQHPIGEVMEDYIESTYSDILEKADLDYDEVKIKPEKSGGFYLTDSGDQPLYDEDGKPLFFTGESVNGWATPHYRNQAVKNRREDKHIKSQRDGFSSIKEGTLKL